MIIKYGIVHTAAGELREVRNQDFADLDAYTQYAAAYALNTPGWRMVRISNTFPEGHDWSQNSTGFEPKYQWPTVADIQIGYRKLALEKSQLMRYAGTFEYNGGHYIFDHEMQDSLLQLRALRNDLPSNSFPIYIPDALDASAYLTLSHAQDVKDVTDVLLAAVITRWNGFKAELESIAAANTFETILAYTDNRIIP